MRRVADAGQNAEIGRRLRELRLERGLQQADVARQLAVSPAYLNLMEKGKRAVQLPLLWKALSLFGMEMEPFMRSLGAERAENELARMLDDPLLRTLRLDPHDLESLSAEPRMAATIAALYNLYKGTRAQLEQVLRSLDQTNRAASLAFDESPFDEVTEFLQARRNWFPALEERARKVRADDGLGRRVHSEELVGILQERHGIRVVKAEAGDGSSVVRRLDLARATLSVSPDLLEQPLKFQLAATIGLLGLEEDDLAAGLVAGYAPRHPETPRLIKIHLANYLAGAILLPYEDFHAEVTRTRYDVELLAQVFGTTYETVAHRVCNLGDPRRPGLPFHFLRCDAAGNISKRYSATGLEFPRGTGSCPKMAVHVALLTPSVITRQYSMMPDGELYFCFAKVVTEPLMGNLARGTIYSIGLGTHADNARHLAYAADMPLVDPARMAVPVGVTCRFCERTDCNQRAAPSYKFAFAVDEYTKKDNFFSPLMGHEALLKKARGGRE